MPEPIRFSVLGPLEIGSGERRIDPGPFKQRVVLGMLLCRANTVVPVPELLAAVWPTAMPSTARKNLQVYVSTLRRIVGNRIRHLSYGYRIEADQRELDVLAFRGLVDRARFARRDRDPVSAERLLADALRLWRDEALVDLRTNPAIADEAEQLTHHRLAVYEDWADLAIELGRHHDVGPDVAQRARRHPFRERLVAAAMTALHRSGRRGEALATFEWHRQLMARELGLDPSPVLRQLYGSVLADEPEAVTGSPAPVTGAASVTVPAAVPQHVPGTVAAAVPVAVPADVPRDVRLVGRSAHVDAALACLDGNACDVAVVSGPVGAGKTALAIKVAHLLADRFPDGQLFVPLRDAAGRPRAIPEVVGDLLSTGPCGSEPEAVKAWRSWIASRRALVVLDDAASEEQVRVLLPGRGPSRTLVTSCRRLSDLESVGHVPVGELDLAEAVDLLALSVGPARLGDAGESVSRIVERCGATPAALRAVAGKLNALRHVSPAALADRLESSATVLDELSIRPRLRRLWTSLSPPCRCALLAISRVERSVLGHDQVVSALPSGTGAEGVVEELVETHTLVAGDARSSTDVRYRVPPLVRRLAVEEPR